MKCNKAEFQDVKVWTDDNYGSFTTERKVVECGGEIFTVWGNKEKDIPAHYYCTRCGMRYEKLPEGE